MNKSRSLTVEIVSLVWIRTGLLNSYQYVGPGVDTAIADLSVAYPNLNFTQHLIFDASLQTCQDWAAVYEYRMAEFYYRSRRRPGMVKANLTVFIFPGCSGLDFPGIARLAAGLKKVVLSTGSTTPYMYDKRNFPALLTSTFVSSPAYTAMYRRLLELYDWKTIMILVDSTGNLGYPTISRNVIIELKQAFLGNIVQNYATGNISSKNEMASVFRLFRDTSRVMLLFADDIPVRNFLGLANQENLTDGSFVFLVSFPGPKFGEHSASSYTIRDEFDEEVLKAFRVCLFLEFDPAAMNVEPQLGAIWKDISRRKYNYTYGDDETVSPGVLAAYAGTATMGQVVNELNSRLDDFNWNNDAAIAKEFFNRTFTTRVGPITYSAMGERLTPFAFSYFDQDRKQFVAAFKQDNSVKLDVHVGQPIVTWPAPWPVLNEPRCGYRGDRMECQNTAMTSLVVKAVGSLVTILLGILSVIYCGRRIFLAHFMNNDWWRLDNSLTFQISRTAR